MSGLLTSVTNIPAFAHYPIPMPLICFIIGMIVVQMLAVVCVGFSTLAISAWRKNDIQALFFCLLLLVVPLVLKLMGFDFARWFSVYPIYIGGIQ